MDLIMYLYTWLGENWQMLLNGLLTLIVACSLVVRWLAPKTSWGGDDKAVAWLDWLYTKLVKLAVNPPVQPW